MRLVVAVASLILMVTAAGATAAPDRRFEVLDRGDQVEVIATGVTAKPGAKVAVVRERLEIELAGMPRPGARESADATVQIVEIRGSRRVLSMKLRLEHDGVVAVRGLAAFVQTGDTLHVTIPRQLPTTAAAAPVTATAPTQPAAVVTPPVTPPVTSASVETPPAAATAGATPGKPSIGGATTPAAATVVVTAEPPLPPSVTGTGTGTAPSVTPLRPQPRSPFAGSRWLLVLVGLVLVGGGVAAVLKRNRKPLVAGADIDVIASRSLGGKSRIVWLAAGDREVLVAVSPQAVRLLGSWRRGDRGDRTDRTLGGLGELGELDELGELELEPALAERPARQEDERAARRDLERPVRPDTERPRAEVARGSSVHLQPSAAVSGILRLRGQSAAARAETNSKPPSDHASDDPEADEQWARDVLANTNGGPR